LAEPSATLHTRERGVNMQKRLPVVERRLSRAVKSFAIGLAVVVSGCGNGPPPRVGCIEPNEMVLKEIEDGNIGRCAWNSELYMLRVMYDCGWIE
jgi:hypothetical protein